MDKRFCIIISDTFKRPVLYDSKLDKEYMIEIANQIWEDPYTGDTGTNDIRVITVDSLVEILNSL